MNSPSTLVALLGIIAVVVVVALYADYEKTIAHEKLCNDSCPAGFIVSPTAVAGCLCLAGGAP